MCSKTIVVANKSLVIIGCMVVNEVKMGIHLYYKWDKPKQMDKVAVRVLLVVVGCMLFLVLKWNSWLLDSCFRDYSHGLFYVSAWLSALALLHDYLNYWS